MKSTLYGYSVNKHIFEVYSKWWFVNLNIECKYGCISKFWPFTRRNSSNLFDSLFLIKPIKPLIGISI